MKQRAQEADVYHKFMEVSPYNKGRDVSMISGKTWAHGTREYLRPDTLYADERYSNITQKEINEAKARVASRKEAKKLAESNLPAPVVKEKYHPKPDESHIYHRPPNYP